ncbi:MAG: DUF3011 domain-containing protein [Lysobacter sp.]
MHRITCLTLALMLGVLATPIALAAPPQQRAYAPEDLRELSPQDQRRVIGLEYAEQSGGRSIPADQMRFYLDQVNRSSWTFSRIKADIATSLGGSTAPPTAGTIRCESNDGRSRTCRTPWRGDSRLVRQLSQAPCVEGRTWQSQTGQVYVGGGCRAEFAAATGPGGPSPRPQPQPVRPGYTVECANSSLFPVICRWDDSRGTPYLKRKLSEAPCIEGVNWGYRRGTGIWVSAGCRAEFGAR